MDRRSGGDPSQARTQAEERSVRCPTHIEVDGGRNLSSHLGANSGESGSTTAGVAPASPGGNANSGDESAPGRGHERRHTAEEGAVDREGPATARVTGPHAVDNPTPARTIEAIGPARSQHRRA